MDKFGSYFKSLREAKGLTLREVEAQTGISNAYLSQLEKDKVKQPSPMNLHKLANLYGVSYDLLMAKVGYPVSEQIESQAESKGISSRFGRISREEEAELLDYLKFIRLRNKK